MKYIKNTAIIIGFWIIGMIFGMLLILSLGLESPIAESINRDIAFAIMFTLIAWYFKNKYYYYVSSIMLFFGLWQIFNYNAILPEQTPKKEFSIQSYIDKSAIHMSKTLPQDIDSDTRVDSVIALPNTLKFFYTMKAFAKSEINQEYLHSKFVMNVKLKTVLLKSGRLLSTTMLL